MSSERKSLLKAAGVVSAITLLSRALGLVRDAVIAARLGAGYFSDCLNIAFEIPNLTRRVLGEGSLSAFIVPVYSRARKEEGDSGGWRFVSNALNTFTLLTLLLTALGIIFSKQLFIIFGGIKYFARGETEYLNLGTSLTQIMFPFLMFLALASLLMGVLHSHRHFTMPALGSVMLNITIILASFIFAKVTPKRFTFVLAWAVLIGVVLRVAILIPPLIARGFRYTPVLRAGSPRLRQLYKMMLPATLGLAVVHLNIMVDSNFANFLGPGRVTYLRNANRLIQFPLALFASAIATAILPQLTGYLLEDKKRQLKQTMSFAFRLLMIIFIPATVGLIALGQPIIELILQRGYWTAEATLNTQFALMFYALGLLPIAFLRIITPLYYARQDVMTPFKMGAIALGINIALNAFFIFFTPLEHGGLAFASSIAAAVNFYLLYHREREVFGTVFTEEARNTFHRTLAAAILMGFCVWGLHRGMCTLYPANRFLLKAIFTLGSVGLGAAFFVFFGKIFRIPELDEALRLILRRK